MARNDPFDGIGDPVVVFTFGRSGTHLTLDLIRRQFADFASWKFPGEPCSYTYSWLDRLVTDGVGRWDRHRLGRAARPLLLTHHWFDLQPDLSPALRAWLTRGRLIHLVRDPRAAMASAWPIHSARDARAGRAPADPAAYVEQHGRRWASDLRAMASTPALTLVFEDLVADPAPSLARIGDWIGAPALWHQPLVAPPHRSRAASRLARLTSIRPASSAAVELKCHRDRYRLAWTPELEAILNAVAGDELAAAGYACPPSPVPAFARPGREAATAAVGMVPNAVSPGSIEYA